MAKRKSKKTETYGPGIFNPVEQSTGNSGSHWSTEHLKWLFIEQHDLSTNRWELPDDISNVERRIFAEIDKDFGLSWKEVQNAVGWMDDEVKLLSFYTSLIAFHDQDSSSPVHDGEGGRRDYDWRETNHEEASQESTDSAGQVPTFTQAGSSPDILPSCTTDNTGYERPEESKKQDGVNEYPQEDRKRHRNQVSSGSSSSSEHHPSKRRAETVAEILRADQKHNFVSNRWAGNRSQPDEDLDLPLYREESHTEISKYDIQDRFDSAYFETQSAEYGTKDQDKDDELEVSDAEELETEVEDLDTEGRDVEDVDSDVPGDEYPDSDRMGAGDSSTEDQDDSSDEDYKPPEDELTKSDRESKRGRYESEVDGAVKGFLDRIATILQKGTNHKMKFKTGHHYSGTSILYWNKVKLKSFSDVCIRRRGAKKLLVTENKGLNPGMTEDNVLGQQVSHLLTMATQTREISQKGPSQRDDAGEILPYKSYLLVWNYTKVHFIHSDISEEFMVWLEDHEHPRPREPLRVYRGPEYNMKNSQDRVDLAKQIALRFLRFEAFKTHEEPDGTTST
ncbi:hypothetical protein BU16DRAFT_557198 [Lophium mytilinum]|uniref:Uncharacterized protein n=1 Tax=Lophium mytilinum TaxID=390894 RepID=A0A6A6R816_9PEZI|nr:hypothetical protein BU16DRAFT_557198 [Lophium mytilinum]